jgi:hypothetical protein
MGPMHAAATSRMTRVDGDEDTIYSGADGRDSDHCKAALTSGTSVFGVHVGVRRVRLALARWWLRADINVRPTHLYRAESPPGTSASHLHRVGRRRPQHAPARVHLYRLVPPTGTNVVICTEVKNSRYKSKNRPEIYVRFSSSVSPTSISI